MTGRGPGAVVTSRQSVVVRPGLCSQDAEMARFDAFRTRNRGPKRHILGVLMLLFVSSGGLEGIEPGAVASGERVCGSSAELDA